MLHSPVAGVPITSALCVGTSHATLLSAAWSLCYAYQDKFSDTEPLQSCLMWPRSPSRRLLTARVKRSSGAASLSTIVPTNNPFDLQIGGVSHEAGPSASGICSFGIRVLDGRGLCCGAADYEPVAELRHYW